MPFDLKRLTLAASALALFAATAAPAAAEQQTLRFANWVPSVHHMASTIDGWIQTVAAASGGDLVIELDKQPLAKPPGQYDLVQNGVRDFAWGVPAYTPNRMPMVRAAEIPFLSANATTGSPALYRWYTKHGFDKKEFDDTKLITVFVHGPGILSSRIPIRGIADLKNVKIRAHGGGVKTAEALGAVPVVLTPDETQEALRRGTVEGFFFPWEAVKGFHLMDLVEYHLEAPGGLYTTPFFVNLNLKAWDKLSAANKEALEKTSGLAAAKLFGQGWDKADQVVREEALSKGHKIFTVDAGEAPEWEKRLSLHANEWIEKANSLGHDGKALYEDLAATMKAPTN